MKKIFVLFLSIFIFSTSNAKDLSEFLSNIIPGEGLTEASIQINEEDNPDLEILALRETAIQTTSDLLTQIEQNPPMNWTKVEIEERTEKLAEISYDDLWSNR